MLLSVDLSLLVRDIEKVRAKKQRKKNGSERPVFFCDSIKKKRSVPGNTP